MSLIIISYIKEKILTGRLLAMGIKYEQKLPTHYCADSGSKTAALPPKQGDKAAIWNVFASFFYSGRSWRHIIHLCTNMSMQQADKTNSRHVILCRLMLDRDYKGTVKQM